MRYQNVNVVDVVVEARQFSSIDHTNIVGFARDLMEFDDWVVERPEVASGKYSGSDFLFSDSLGHLNRAGPGDWVVCYQDASFVLSDEDFKQTYERVAE